MPVYVQIIGRLFSRIIKIASADIAHAPRGLEWPTGLALYS
jgi:hypothetical protein